MTNFKQIADEKIQTLKEQIQECSAIGEQFSQDEVIGSLLDLMADMYIRLTEFETIPFDDRPPAIVNIETKSLNAIVNILLKRFKTLVRRLEKNQH